MPRKPLLIMVAGPYSSGGANSDQRAANLRALNEAALAVQAKGHTPLIGVNAVLPMIELAGHDRYSELMMPICRQLAAHCDAVLRIGGPSQGADEEVEIVIANGGIIFRNVAEIPMAD
ncbi:MAG: hypothetical protein KDE14_09265 [Rhodobacteraceae bacterium]|nr:hypothetical protein [Paracoccaceae bacterium]